MNIDRRSFMGAGISLAAWQDVVAQNVADIGKTPNTRFAVNVEMWWRKLPFLDRVQAAIDFGFPGIEFWPWKGKDLDAIERMTKDAGVEVAQFTAWGFNPGMNDPENYPAFVIAVRDGIEVAHKLGAKAMTVVAGNDQEGMTTEEMHENVINGLKLVSKMAEDADVTLILEPMNGRVDHPGHCLYGIPPAIPICEEVDSTHVKINWDLYHMQITEGDLCGRLREGIEQIGYVQLADHPGRHEPGTGEIHYPRVLKEVHDLGYRGLVGLECSPRDGELTAARRVAAADRW